MTTALQSMERPHSLRLLAQKLIELPPETIASELKIKVPTNSTRKEKKWLAKRLAIKFFPRTRGESGKKMRLASLATH